MAPTALPRRASEILGVVLFMITLVVNSLSRLLIWSMNRTSTSVVVAEPSAEAAA